MPSQIVDYILIGQGLAGSMLAHQLIMRGKTLVVMDNNHHMSSSKVAAGIINPITGPRLSLSDNFKRYYPYARQTYANLEKTLGITLYQALEQHRLIQTQEQLDYYHKRAIDYEYQDNLGKRIDSPYLKNQFGAIELFQSGVVDTKKLISHSQKWLIEKDSYIAGKLDYQQIQSNDDGFTIGQTTARQIIFCEGFQAINNPWLSHLPFKLSKGEILSLSSKQTINHLLNWGNWLVPINDSGSTSVKLGSNYAWNDLNLEPSEQIKNQLLNSLHTNTYVQAQIILHEVGIRPTTKQRKPFIGALNNLANAYCFNGFGSKGCLLIPYFVDLFCEHLINNTRLEKQLSEWL